MKEDPTKFVNFQHVIVGQFAYTSCLAFLVVALMVRLLKMGSYSKKTAKVTFYHLLFF